jgi:hypothetical protein
MTRYFIDTEFCDTGVALELISLGVVCECGDELYVQHSDFSNEDVSAWVKDNVFPQLAVCPDDEVYRDRYGIPARPSDPPNEYHMGVGRCKDKECPWRSQVEIRDAILDFFNPSDPIELWGWCSGYDFVAFCQIFGTMMDLPSFFPHYIRDFQQVLDDRGITDEELPQQEDGKHNALEDARYLEKLWGYIVCNNAWQ